MIFTLVVFALLIVAAGGSGLQAEHSRPRGSMRTLSSLRRRLAAATPLDLDKALVEAFKALDLIYQRYELHNIDRLMFFFVSNNMDGDGWDMLKYVYIFL